MKNAFQHAPGALFDQVLADLERSRPRAEGARRALDIAASAAFPILENEAGAAQASPDVFDEADEPPQEIEPCSGEDPEAIARELGLDRAASEAELNRAKRRFMWRNHPDRCPESLRAIADRRVAIANMLIDRARAELAAPKRR